MQIDVAFTPGEAQALDDKICVAVDVLRSSSSLAVILSKRPKNLVLTATVQRANKLAGQRKEMPYLCGERDGLAPVGFNFGNSPIEYFESSLSGKDIIYTSSNGVRAITDLLIAPHVLIGCFLNASAVVKQAYNYATDRNCGVLFVCAGRDEKFAIDDAYCAGFLVSKLISLIPASESFTLEDGAQAALGIFGYYRDPKRLLEMSGAGRHLIELGLAEDLNFVLNKDLIECVPELRQKKMPEPEYGFSVAV